VAEYWIDFGIDGWRLDVPGDIDDDSFWQEFRQRVKAKNNDAYICGEIWEKADRWLQGDQFDSVMNYPMGMAALSFFGAETMKTDYKQNHLDLTPVDSSEFIERVNKVYSWYDWEINRVQLNLIDSHDMPRAKWLVQDNVAAVEQALAFLLLAPGAPCIYYGTEVGMTGGNDPHCREAFPWDAESTWQQSTMETIKRFANIRHQYDFLAQADISLTVLTDDVVMMKRTYEASTLVALFNRSGEEVVLSENQLLAGLKPLGMNESESTIRLNDEIILKKNSTEVFVS
jgi:neopullulanase